MTPDEASGQSGAEHSGGSTSVAPRPGGRSRYSRGRRRPRRSTNRPRRIAPEGGSQEAQQEQMESPVRSEAREPLPPPFQPAKVESVQAAIDKVSEIIGDLRDTLNEMELVLEYLEDVERQQIADEREIELLQQRLNSMHRRTERHQPHSRPAPPHAEDTGDERSD